MKSFLIFGFASMVSLVSIVVRAEQLDTRYGGQIISASKNVSVQYEDGTIKTFNVADIESASVTNESYLKVATLSASHSGSSCSRMIGELASEYEAVFKTDENEFVKMSFKASTPENPVRITGDCENGISGEFSLYVADSQPLPLDVKMSSEPAGAPGPKARYYGDVIEVSPKISVRADDGTVRVLSAAGLKVGGIYNDLKSVMLSVNGMMTMCGDSLGELASDFTVTIKTKKGMVRKATVRAPREGESAAGRVRVYGVCHGGSLSQLQLDAKNGALFEVQ